MASDAPPSLGFVLNRVAQAIRERTAAVLTPLGIGPRHCGLMRHLHVGGPMSQVALSEHHRIDRTTMVALLDDLEARGLVRRMADQTDRRRHAVLLTEDGQALYAKAASAVHAVERQFVAALSAAEARQVHKLLEKLLHSVTARQEPDTSQRTA
jgi:DNA-binding MarR family transcriptional regulator